MPPWPRRAADEVRGYADSSVTQCRRGLYPRRQNQNNSQSTQLAARL